MASRTVTDGLDTPTRVAGKATRRRRKRTKAATIERRIQAKARERERLQREGGHPLAVRQLTTDLNGREHLLRPEGLFAEKRGRDAGAMEPGNPSTTGAFRR